MKLLNNLKQIMRRVRERDKEMTKDTHWIKVQYVTGAILLFLLYPILVGYKRYIEGATDLSSIIALPLFALALAAIIIWQKPSHGWILRSSGWGLILGACALTLGGMTSTAKDMVLDLYEKNPELIFADWIGSALLLFGLFWIIFPITIIMVEIIFRMLKGMVEDIVSLIVSRESGEEKE